MSAVSASKIFMSFKLVIYCSFSERRKLAKL
jgi:hypothetical protein